MVHAALNAGVIDGVWLSKANPQAGEEIRLYTAIQNQSDQAVSGSVAFVVDGTIVGTTLFFVEPNDIQAVSVPYTFPGGTHDVSAYIASVAQEPVVYTTASKRPITVSTSEQALNDAQKDPLHIATTTAKVLTNETKQKTKQLLETTTPVIDRTADSIDRFREYLLEPTIVVTKKDDAENAEESAQTIEQPTTPPPQPPSATPSFANAKNAVTTFARDAKSVMTREGAALWEKGAAIALTILSLLLRLWYVIVTIVVLYTFWRLVHGRRIR